MTVDPAFGPPSEGEGEGTPRVPRMGRYDVFISYKHGADSGIAQLVQRGLERFNAPWYRARTVRVFRDTSSLSAAPDAWLSIEQALAESSWFLLVATPKASGSRYVNREVEWWLKNRSIDQLLLVVADGIVTWDNDSGSWDQLATDALPPALTQAQLREPLWVDLRSLPEPLQSDHPDVQTALAKLISPIRGLPVDEVLGEHVRQRHRTRRLAGSILALLSLLLVVSLVATLTAVDQRGEARKQQRDAERQRDSVLTGSLLKAADDRWLVEPALSVRLALTAAKLEKSSTTRAALLGAYFRYPDASRVVGLGEDATALGLSADGNKIAVGSAGRLRLRDSNLDEPGALIQLPPDAQQQAVRKVAFTPDGSLLVYTFGTDRLAIASVANARTIWMAPVAPALTALPRETTGLTANASHDFVVVGNGDLVAELLVRGGSDTAELRLWSTKDHRLISKRDVAAGRALASTADGKSLLMSHSGGVRVLSLPGLAAIRDLPVRDDKDTVGDGTPQWMSALPDGRAIAATGGRLVLFDPRSGAYSRVLARGEVSRASTFGVMEAGGRSNVLVTTEASGLGIWNLSTGRLSRSVKLSPHSVKHLAMSRDERRLAIVDVTGALVISDLSSSRQPTVTLQQPRLEVPWAPSPDGKHLATDLGDGRVAVWQIRDGSVRPLVVTTQPPDDLVFNSLVFSRSGEALAAAGSDGSVWVWDMSTGKETFHMRVHKAPKQMPGASYPFGTRYADFLTEDTLLSLGSDGRLIWYDLRSKTVVRTTDIGYENFFMGFTEAPGSRELVLGGPGVLVRGNREARNLKRIPQPESWSAAYSVDWGRTTAFLVDSRQVELWDLHEGEQLDELRLSDPGANRWRIQLDSTGQHLLSLLTESLSASRLEFWDLSTKELQWSVHVTDAWDGAYLVDAETLFAFESNEVRLWDLDEATVERHLCALGGRSLSDAERREFLFGRDPPPICPR